MNLSFRAVVLLSFRAKRRNLSSRTSPSFPSPEPTYDVIDGAWLTDEPYGVIHRMASYPEVHGIFSTVINYAASHFAHLRIDTHRDNRIMQHLIEKHGFTYCGIIWLEDGTERLAYER